MSSLTNAGFQRNTLQEIRNQIITSMTQVYGPDFDLTEDSPDGQMVQIFASQQYEEDGLAQQAYNSIRPAYATGKALDTLVELNGLIRKAGTTTVGSVTFTGAPSVTVPSGTLVLNSVTNQYKFSTTTNLTLPATGSATVAVNCLQVGTVVIGIGDINTLASPVFGVRSVTNTVAFQTGANSETDSELRLRRAKSTSFPARSLLDGITAAVISIDTVTKVRVYEDPAARSVNVVVLGGDDRTIAYTMWAYKNIGSFYVGSVNYPIVDSQGFPHIISFDRPTPLEVAVQVTFTKIDGLYDTSTEQKVKAGLIEWIRKINIGATVKYWDVSTAINAIIVNQCNNGVGLASLFIAAVGGQLGLADIPVDPKKYGNISAINIQVTING